MFMLMPPVGAFLSVQYGQHQLFGVAVFLELIAAVAAVLLPESLKPAKRQEYKRTTSLRLIAQPLKTLLERRGSVLWELAVVRFLRGLSSSGTMTVVAFALSELVSFRDSDFGSLMALSGFAAMFGQLVLLRLLTWCGCPDLSLLLVATGVATLQSLGYLQLGVHPEKSSVFMLVLLGAGTSIGDPILTALLTKGLQEDFGLLFGIFSAVDGLTSFAGPLLFSLAYGLAGPLCPFAVAALLNGLAAAYVACMHFAARRAAEDVPCRRVVK